MDEVERMTFAEYLYRFKAYRLSRIDVEYDMHLSAWLNKQAGSTKEKGKKTVSAFESFKDFFDYEKRIKDVDKVQVKLSDKYKKMAQMAAKINQ